MAATADVPLADATAMNRFHRIFREALAETDRLVGEAPSGDVPRADLVGSYYDNVLRLLHAHHEAEDLTIYPLMAQRLPQHADVISRMNAEHEGITGPLGAAENAVAAWRVAPSASTRDEAVMALARLQTVLVQHLDDEEAYAVPLIGQCISVAEWGEMSAVAFQHFTGDKPWLVIGLIQEQMLSAENKTMEANMPPPVHDFWVGSGRATFRDFVAELRA